MVEGSKRQRQCSKGFTLIELMVAMSIGLVIILSMMTYYVGAVRSAAVLQSEKAIAETAQHTLSILADAIQVAGSGSYVISEVPFYAGDCGNFSPCTADGGGSDSDRFAVRLSPENGKTCGNTRVGQDVLIANVYYLDTIDNTTALYCRAFNLDSSEWAEEPSVLSVGVENIQMLYLVRNMENATSRTVSADSIEAVEGNIEGGWDRVRAAQISVIISEGSGSTTPDTPNLQRFELADSGMHEYTDRILRRSYSTKAIIFSKLGHD